MDVKKSSIVVVGAGVAGLITAQVLIKDGFTNVTVLARERNSGGVWSEDRLYPGVYINNVSGEYEFTPLQMHRRPETQWLGYRISGNDLQAYTGQFVKKFLSDRVQYGVEVLSIRRPESSLAMRSSTEQYAWSLTLKDTTTGRTSELACDKIVLCTGGCSEPLYAPNLTLSDASAAHFAGPVVHSAHFNMELNTVLSAVRPASEEDSSTAVVVGSGKSAQDIAALLANEGRKVKVVFESADAFLAHPKPLPDFLRRSRMMGIMMPYRTLNTRLERFLHTTWLGSCIVHAFWKMLRNDSFKALDVPEDSPLRNAPSPFWCIRLNDEGVPRPNSFFSLVNEGKIELVSPARAAGFGADGKSIVLKDGRIVQADAVILATGYQSSWKTLFDKQLMDDLGLSRHPPTMASTQYEHEWDQYRSLANSPPTRTNEVQWAGSIYRGVVPARNILCRDLAVNGAVFSINNGHVYETSAHWISSYFLEDQFLRVPSPEEAFAATERNAVWMRKRYPNMLLWANESYSAAIEMFTWPQWVDDLLGDMGLRTMRSGGNWLTWPFKIVHLKEISTLHEERAEQRASALGT